MKKMSSDDLRSLELSKARKLFVLFAKAVQPRLSMSDFHIKYYRVLHRFAVGQIKKLIVTVPPQHGKSEGSTRLLPAFLLGLNPDLKIAIASYSDTFAKRFNRDVQRIIDSPVYGELFPETRLNAKRIVTVTAAPLRNSSDFEIVGHLGSLKAVGRGGGLTGNPVDVIGQRLLQVGVNQLFFSLFVDALPEELGNTAVDQLRDFVEQRIGGTHDK